MHKNIQGIPVRVSGDMIRLGVDGREFIFFKENVLEMLSMFDQTEAEDTLPVNEAPYPHGLRVSAGISRGRTDGNESPPTFGRIGEKAAPQDAVLWEVVAMIKCNASDRVWVTENTPLLLGYLAGQCLRTQGPK